MLLAQADIEFLAPPVVQFAEVAILVAVGVALFVFEPQNLQGHVFPLKLFKQVFHGRHGRFVGSLPWDI